MVFNEGPLTSVLVCVVSPKPSSTSPPPSRRVTRLSSPSLRPNAVELPLPLPSLCSPSVSQSWKSYLQNAANPAGAGPRHHHHLDGQTTLLTASWSAPAATQNPVMASRGTQRESRCPPRETDKTPHRLSPGTSVLPSPIAPQLPDH